MPLIVRYYWRLLRGDINGAMLLVTGGRRPLGGVHPRTAHLVRAGLAAGKLLDEGGLSTMFSLARPAQTLTPPTRPEQPTKLRLL